MDLFTLILLAIGLSMDAFAVSICKGLAIKKISFRHMLIVGAWFGCFQAIMPMIGYFLGIQFAKFVNAFAPWIAFIQKKKKKAESLTPSALRQCY